MPRELLLASRLLQFAFRLPSRRTVRNGLRPFAQVRRIDEDERLLGAKDLPGDH